LKVLAFIPARGGSKGLPGKNIKMLAGKPLIAWSIEQAKASTLIDRVIVSTDCPEIAKIAIQYGAEVPFYRPENIAGDNATTESAMLHCCEYLKERDELPDYIVLIQATSPIRSIDQFDKALVYIKNNDFDSLLSVSKSHRFTWNKQADKPVASYDYMKRPRRQDISEADQVFLETGSFYITRINRFLETKNRLCGTIGLFETPEDESYEIDTIVDFTICEEILKLKNVE
jgi:CMP-N,N'-diacetyllegionaminic acid synthase